MLNNDIIGSSHDEKGKLDNGHVRLFAEGVPPLKEAPSPELRTLLVTGGENDSITRQLARHVKETGERYVAELQGRHHLPARPLPARRRPQPLPRRRLRGGALHGAGRRLQAPAPGPAYSRTA
jgi:hypothetical protein